MSRGPIQEVRACDASVGVYRRAGVTATARSSPSRGRREGFFNASPAQLGHHGRAMAVMSGCPHRLPPPACSAQHGVTLCARRPWRCDDVPLWQWMPPSVGGQAFRRAGSLTIREAHGDLMLANPLHESDAAPDLLSVLYPAQGVRHTSRRAHLKLLGALWWCAACASSRATERVSMCPPRTQQRPAAGALWAAARTAASKVSSMGLTISLRHEIW